MILINASPFLLNVANRKISTLNYKLNRNCHLCVDIFNDANELDQMQ